MPALAAPAWHCSGVGTVAWVAVMLTIDPPVFARCSNAARETLNVPHRSMSTTVRNPLAEREAAGERKLPAALLTTTSSRPNSATHPVTAAATSSYLRTSAGNTFATPPVSVMWAATASSFSLVRPRRATLHPCAASMRARPAPMPLPPPVTKATLPTRRSLAKTLLMGGRW